MNIQASFATSEYGKLYIVPTPIGHLADMTYRAVQTLQDVQLIAAEDTRHTKKLLNHYEISTPLISYHEHNEQERSDQLIDQLVNGEHIALVSDAGMPGISDPGHILIQRAIAAEIAIIVLPGANAALTALIGSGLSTDKFLFYGFLPRKQKAKRDILAALKNQLETIIFYESPFRIKNTVATIYHELGNRQIVIARELTKQFETYIRGKASEVNRWLKTNDIKGECCLIVSGSEQAESNEQSLWWSPFSVVEHVNHYKETEHLTTKEAVKNVAKDRQMGPRDVYQMYHR